MKRTKQQLATTTLVLLGVALIASFLSLCLFAKHPASLASQECSDCLRIKTPGYTNLFAQAFPTEVTPYVSFLRVTKSKVKNYACPEYGYHSLVSEQARILNILSTYRAGFLFTTPLYLYHCTLLI